MKGKVTDDTILASCHWSVVNRNEGVGGKLKKSFKYMFVFSDCYFSNFLNEKFKTCTNVNESILNMPKFIT